MGRPSSYLILYSREFIVKFDIHIYSFQLRAFKINNFVNMINLLCKALGLIDQIYFSAKKGNKKDEFYELIIRKYN
jgi:hypothetical protein